MKPGSTLLLLAIVSFFIQSRPDGVGRIESSYDRDADLTTVQFELVQLGKGAPKLIVEAIVTFRGKEPNETAKFWLGLSSYRGSATRRTRPLFKDEKTVRLAVDSTVMELPIKDYHNDFYELNRLLAEQARAEIRRDDLQKLLEAMRIEGSWGEVEFKFSEAALKSLKDFISHNVFSANGR
jgi:hypothetical protein